MPNILINHKGETSCAPATVITVTGNNNNQIWGINPYTDDSEWGKAAVHAELISIGETAQIALTPVGVLPSFPSSVANGIESVGWGTPWCGVTISLAEPHYTLTIQIVGEGTVTISPNETNFINGSNVSLIAVSANSWQFQGWSGDLISTDVNASITISKDTVITATFSKSTLTYYVIVIQSKYYLGPEWEYTWEFESDPPDLIPDQLKNSKNERLMFYLDTTGFTQDVTIAAARTVSRNGYNDCTDIHLITIPILESMSN